MHRWLAILIVSLVGLGPGLLGAGTAGTTGEQPPAQKQTISTDDFKLIQQRLTAEGVYAGPIDGEMNAQTSAALRQYQEKQETITKWGLRGMLYRLLAGPHAWIPPTKQVPEVTV